jgi:hypothetical protein
MPDTVLATARAATLVVIALRAGRGNLLKTRNRIVTSGDVTEKYQILRRNFDDR